MLIEICKKTQYACEYSITRDDTTQEHFTLETKTYFLHDICHYVVEKQLQFKKGLWGMLSIGHSLQELFGKENPLTPELRFIEQIVDLYNLYMLGICQNSNFLNSSII
jgi:hypothetical protein